MVRRPRTTHTTITHIGIDPGKSGGIVGLQLHYHNDTGVLSNTDVEWWVMPDSDILLLNTLELLKNSSDQVFAVLEQVNSMPRDGNKGLFTFGEGYGKLQMALAAHQIQYSLARPQVWQKYHKIASRKPAESQQQFKDRMMGVARRLYPDMPLWEAKRSLGVQRSISDALLIADYSLGTYNKKFKK